MVPLPFPKPPRETYAQVNDVDAVRVAGLLGLQKAREHRKYACPAHGGSDSLHAYPGGKKRGFSCFSCDNNGNKGWSNVDLAAMVWGLDPAEACQQLADRLGIFVASHHNPPPSRRNGPRRPERASRAQVQTPAPRPERSEPVAVSVLDAIRADGMVPQEPSGVYRAILEALTLTEKGASYLRGRGLDPELALSRGFRAIDDAAGWGELRELLAANFCPDEQEAAGCLKRDDDGEQVGNLPWGGHGPCLVIPYVWSGEVVAIKFRHLAPSNKDKRYRTLKPTDVEVGDLPPFNADVLTRCQGETLHVVEGELNALAIAQEHGIAVGLPSAIWPKPWTPKLDGVRRLVLWFDDDKGSNTKAVKFAGAVQAHFGGNWRRNHLSGRVPLPRDPNNPGKNLDANDLLMRGTLRELIDQAERD